jgi:hypothetical protein
MNKTTIEKDLNETEIAITITEIQNYDSQNSEYLPVL